MWWGELSVIKMVEDAREFGQELDGGDHTDGEPQFQRTVMCAYACVGAGGVVGGLLEGPRDEA